MGTPAFLSGRFGDHTDPGHEPARRFSFTHARLAAAHRWSRRELNRNSRP